MQGFKDFQHVTISVSDNDLQTGLRHIGFKVRDTNAMMERLKTEGVEFTLGPLDATGGARIAFFKDPDGNAIELIDGTCTYDT